MNQMQIHKDYVGLIAKISSGSHRVGEVFKDACRMYALCLHSPLVINADEKREVEDEFARIRGKYSEDEYKTIQQSFAVLALGLEKSPKDFLGIVLEELSCNRKELGQFFTPACVASLMAHVTFDDEFVKNHKRGEIITLNDPACGAGVLLIEQAMCLIEKGVPQGDILVFAEDLDPLSFSIAFTQLSLLGIPAVVTRRNSLSLEIFEGPWYTIGYFAHRIPMRRIGEDFRDVELGYKSQGNEENKEVDVDDKTDTMENETPTTEKNSAVQMELF